LFLIFPRNLAPNLRLYLRDGHNNNKTGPLTIHPEQNMKTKIISIIAFPLFLCAAACILSLTAFVLTNADAQITTGTVGPGPGTLNTGIKGTIKVPAPATSGPFVGFGCANLVVIAESKAHDWTRSSKPAKGTYSTGTCRYTLPVPPSPIGFTMNVGVISFIPKGPCIVKAAATGLGDLWTVPQGTWKTNNFRVTDLFCVVP